jgi:hypothetical protein
VGESGKFVQNSMRIWPGIHLGRWLKCGFEGSADGLLRGVVNSPSRDIASGNGSRIPGSWGAILR